MAHVVRKPLIGPDGKLYFFLKTEELALGDSVLIISGVCHWNITRTTKVIKIDSSYGCNLDIGYRADNAMNGVCHPTMTGTEISSKIIDPLPVSSFLRPGDSVPLAQATATETERSRLLVQRRMLAWPYQHTFLGHVENDMLRFFFVYNPNAK